MEEAEKHLMPQGKKEGLAIQRLSNEILIYDLERHKAHCLNKTAALVWKNCDGRTTVEDVARALTDELGKPVDEEIVLLAIDQLNKARLLSERIKRPAGSPALSRRELMRRLGLAAAVSLPLITTIVAPTAFAAASCQGTKKFGDQCSSPSECISCICTGGFCGA